MSTATAINHVSLHADDLEASAAFYCEVFGLEPIPTPSFKLPVRWLRLGHQQLHLMQADTEAPRFHHLGLTVDDFESVYRRAKERQLLDTTTFVSHVCELPDGAVQMYLRDPAGNLVEVNWPDASKLDRTVVTDLVRLVDLVPQGDEGLRAKLFLPEPA